MVVTPQHFAPLQPQNMMQTNQLVAAMDHYPSAFCDYYVLYQPDVRAQLAIFDGDRPQVAISKEQAAGWIGKSITLYRESRDFFRTIDERTFEERNHLFHIGIDVNDRAYGTAGPGNFVLSTGALDSDYGWLIATHELAHVLQFDRWEAEDGLFYEHLDVEVNGDSPLLLSNGILPLFFEASRLGDTSYVIPGRGPVIRVDPLYYEEYLNAPAHRAAAGLAYFLWDMRDALISEYGDERGTLFAHRLFYKGIEVFGQWPVKQRLTYEVNARLFSSNIAVILAYFKPDLLPRFKSALNLLGFPAPSSIISGF